jgi:formate hydrogenlyase subunit 6/NADH:ubiquinone oxidoreductase subunit I
MNDTVKNSEKEEYLYVVHGVIPEAMPPVAYRRMGQADLIGRKLIKCPYCRELLTDVERTTLVQLFKLTKGKKKKEIPSMVVKRCIVCKENVGMVMTI